MTKRPSVKVRSKSGFKYQADLLITMFRKAAEFRNQMLDSGFSDNAGAIHSAERVMDLLGLRLNYPGLSHRNNLRTHDQAKFSKAAWNEYKHGRTVRIEHVAPLRAFTRKAIEFLNRKVDDKAFARFVRRHYVLVLLTPEEMQRLNRVNASKMDPHRLRSANITKLVTRKLEMRKQNRKALQPAVPRKTKKKADT